jgi:hypothetical protein
MDYNILNYEGGLTFEIGAPHPAFFMIYTGSTYELVGVDDNRFNYAVSGGITDFIEADAAIIKSATGVSLTKGTWTPVYAPFLFDTANDAFYEIGSSPTKYPIYSYTLTPLSTFTFTGEGFFEPVQSVSEAAAYTQTVQAKQTAAQSSGSDLSFLSSLINAIMATIKAIKTFFSTITSLSSWLFAIAAFIFAVKSFVGITVLITLLNAVYCMKSGPGVDMFLAFNKFIQNEVKILEFYMKLILWAKELIKWW